MGPHSPIQHIKNSSGPEIRLGSGEKSSNREDLSKNRAISDNVSSKEALGTKTSSIQFKISQSSSDSSSSSSSITQSAPNFAGLQKDGDRTLNWDDYSSKSNEEQDERRNEGKNANEEQEETCKKIQSVSLVKNLDWISRMMKRHELIENLKDQEFLTPTMTSNRTKSNINSLSSASSSSSSSSTSTSKDNLREYYNDDGQKVIKKSSSKNLIIDRNDPMIKLLAAPLVPPLGFAMVAPGVCRSGHPNHANFTFLEGLKLRSIMYLCTDNYRPHTFNWAQERGLKIFHYRIESFKDPNGQKPDPSLYAAALSNILDRRNLPILIHCNKGQSRVGTLCGILRLIQGWDEVSTKIECDKFYGESAAPPGKNMIWSPGLNFINSNGNSNNSSSYNLSGHVNVDGYHDGRADSKDSKKKGKENKIAEGLARQNQWEYVIKFPIELIELDPNWIPDWLSIESFYDPISTNPSSPSSSSSSSSLTSIKSSNNSTSFLISLSL